jgi:hypothetical protein
MLSSHSDATWPCLPNFFCLSVLCICIARLTSGPNSSTCLTFHYTEVMIINGGKDGEGIT